MNYNDCDKCKHRPYTIIIKSLSVVEIAFVSMCTPFFRSSSFIDTILTTSATRLSSKFSLVSLLNGILTFAGYLMPGSPLQIKH